MTTFLNDLLARGIKDERGTIVIETAIVLPVLVLLSLGTFEASRLVARQYELQSAAAEAELIAMATASGATTSTTTIKQILRASVDLNEDQISVERFYRCNDNDDTVRGKDNCDEDDVVSSYILLNVSDTYAPVWTEFGIGEAIDLKVERTVFLS